MIVTCERCKIEGPLGVFERDDTSQAEASTGRLCISHALIVLGELAQATYRDAANVVPRKRRAHDRVANSWRWARFSR